MENSEYINCYKNLLDLFLLNYLKDNLSLLERNLNNSNLDFFYDIFSDYIHSFEDLKKLQNPENFEKLKNQIVDKYNRIILLESKSDLIFSSYIGFLFETFNFSFFDKFCFIICIFYMLDEKYFILFSSLDFDLDFGISIGLVSNILANLNIDLFDNFSLDFDDLKSYIFCFDILQNQSKPWPHKKLKISNEILNFILTSNYNDPLTQNLICSNFEALPSEAKIFNDLDQFFYNLSLKKIPFNNKLSIFFLKGNKGTGKRTQLNLIARKYNLNFLFIDIDQFISLDIKEISTILKSLVIQAYLSNSILCFYNFSISLNQFNNNVVFLLSYLYNYFSFVAFLTDDLSLDINQFKDSKFVFFCFNIDDLDMSQRLYFWRLFLKDDQFLDQDFLKLARAFYLSIADIKNISLNYSLIKTNDHIKNLNLIRKLCIQNCDYDFRKFASRLDYHVSWDDIVLDDECKQKLLSICDRINFKDKVYNHWDFASKFIYGKGISILFYGPPGTGKTMAAKAIADYVGFELFKIDLSQLLDKYIGQTEKNLKFIFDKAANSNVILFFDEADAMFAKRVSISNSNDKYSNIETAYLLQKIEEFNGISILATNFLSGFDEAFKRRIMFNINFNLPNYKNRLLLWQKAFSDKVKLDKNINFKALAEKFELSGSCIKSIGLAAAFFAAKDGDVITLDHIKLALKNELEKSGKILLDSDLDIY